MKAVGHFKALPTDHPDALVDLELPRPTPGELDLLVRVEAISVNPADYRVRRRKVDDGQPAILGWDVAGTVAEVGTGVSEFTVEDTV
jgi:NADPH:quinone reductase-like Zn-dependent oxidoreductase